MKYGIEAGMGKGNGECRTGKGIGEIENKYCDKGNGK